MWILDIFYAMNKRYKPNINTKILISNLLTRAPINWQKK